MRETMFLMRDFGYDNFEKNIVVVTKFKEQGKLEDYAKIQLDLEKSYNGGAPANAPQPQAQAAAAQF